MQGDNEGGFDASVVMNIPGTYYLLSLKHQWQYHNNFKAVK